MKDIHVWEVVQHRNCENRFDFFKAPIIFSSIFLFRFVFVDFVLLSLVSFYFVFISLISFRFVSFSLISFRFVSFRFYFLSHFIGAPYYRVCNQINTTGATSGAGTAYHSRAPEFTSGSISGVRVTRSLVLYVCFVDRYLSFCTFSFGHCVVWSFSIYVSDYLPLVSSNSSCAYLTTFAFLMPGEQFRLPRASKLKYRHTFVFITLHLLRLKKRPLLLYLCPPL